MREASVFFLRLILVVVGVNVCSIAHAQTGPRYSSVAKCWQSEFPIPDSPDLEKCTECDVDETGTLNCLCKDDESAELKRTSLPIYMCPQYYPFPRCAEQVTVKGGQLGCRKISPESTYQRSCFSCSTQGSVLSCTCWEGVEERKKGVTSLEMKECFQPISSCDGVLTCGLCPEPPTSFTTWAKRVGVGVVVIAGIEAFRRFAWTRIRG